MDVGSWLRSLGLEQYEALFRENDIDAEVLDDLTDADLEKLGVTLGHRKRLLKAIARLNSTHDEPVPGPPAAKPEPKPHDAAERRQLTVMFADLVGSTALSACLDPEDMRSVIAVYHKCCASLIAGNGGFVAKYMGDGVLAYFGYPQAHEHDAERAVRAGLAIVEAAPKLETAANAALHVRVGIATGVVVVGDLLGSGESQERGVVGDTPNLAARLQGIAEPDSVVISEGTRRLLGELFELVDLGPQGLKGAGPTRAYAALRESSQESRFEALHATGLTALVGREEESELLMRRWARAKAGEGQVVLLSGEAGIGKSRLTAAFLERLTGEPYTRLRYFCSPQHTDSALYPIIGHMARAAGLTREDDAKTRLDKLDALLAMSATSIEDAALVAEMMSSPNDGRYPALELAPQLRRQKTMEALIGQIEVISRQSPVLMIFEDVQWADPSSLEMFGRLVDKIDALRVLLFVTFRPEFAALWTERAHVTTLTINRLRPREVIALIDRVRGDRQLPENIKQDIVDRADGIPLFAEEITKAILEAEGEGGARRIIASVPSPALAVPASLHASLMARLDRLGNAKAVAQIGAAIGREFAYALLAAVAHETEAELGSSLNRLVQAGLLYRQSAPPHTTYLFKHALVQDTAYGTLLREPRHAVHAKIAESLESQFPDIAASEPEVLARHCAEAGLVKKAVGYYQKAGEQSVARSAIREAAAHFRKGLDQLSHLPESSDRLHQELELQSALGSVLFAVKGFAAHEPARAFARVRELSQLLGETTHLCRTMFGEWLIRGNGGEVSMSERIARELLHLGEQRQEPAAIMVGHVAMAGTHLLKGDFTLARTHMERLSELHDSGLDRLLVQQFGIDAPIAGCAWLPLDLFLLGFPYQAREQSAKLMLAARRRGHGPTQGWCLSAICRFFLLSGDSALMASGVDEFATLAAEHNFPVWRAQATAYRGWTNLREGNTEEGIALLKQGANEYQATGTLSWLPFLLSLLAVGYGAIGDKAAETGTLDEALAVAARTGEAWFTPELHRLKALVSKSDHTLAEREFQVARDLAKRQRSMLWQLRASTGLAGLWLDQGKRVEAHDLLAPVYSWFTEGVDTLDLKEAKALLDELRA